MSFALARRRGALLNWRLAVKGIQNASRSSEPMSEPEAAGEGTAGCGSLCIRGSPTTGPLRDEGGEGRSLEGSAKHRDEAPPFASEKARFALWQGNVLRCRKISHGGRAAITM